LGVNDAKMHRLDITDCDFILHFEAFSFDILVVQVFVCTEDYFCRGQLHFDVVVDTQIYRPIIFVSNHVSIVEVLDAILDCGFIHRSLV